METAHHSERNLRIALIKQAQEYLRGLRPDPESAKKLAEQLADQQLHSFARRIRNKLYNDGHKTEKDVYDLVISIYKDDDLPSDQRFDLAAKTLLNMGKFGGKAANVQNTKALGILGSIYKRKWKYNSQPENLYHALEFYERGHDLWWKVRQNPDAENYSYKGYCGVNAALIYDLLAAWQLKVKSGNFEQSAAIARHFRAKANRIRRQIVEFSESEKPIYDAANSRFQPENISEADDNIFRGWYWFYATWAEAEMGLGNFAKAEELFLESKKCPHSPRNPSKWQVEIAGKQVIELIYSKFDEGSADFEAALNATKKLLGEFPVRNPGKKVGLALSGGGFRAAIFHIGVLAKLAEEKRLKDIEVISCVSGGSIIGAYYYLKIKNLYETPGAVINDEAFVKIVQEIREEFVQAVAHNLRMKIMGNSLRLLHLLLDFGSRSPKLADLYEKYLYRDLFKKSKEQIEKSGSRHILMKDLKIEPYPGFDHKRDNWKREFKVPNLVLNATNLNTGHNWQFTASWMGESPNYINNEFDALPTLRRMYYDEAPRQHQNIRLATAVGASSCVPMLFAPVVLKNLYEGDISVKLVDGGVQDNQGIYTLLEQECNSLIISDACGQLDEVQKPPSWMVRVLFRTNNIMMARVRDLQFLDLQARRDAGLVRDFWLMHLTKDLDSEVKNWTNCLDKYIPPDPEEQAQSDEDETTYQIPKKIQAKIASIRTDLDSFHEAEAEMLMYAGYKMTEVELSKNKLPKLASTPSDFAEKEAKLQKEDALWHWKRIREALKDEASRTRISRQLETSASVPFKWMFISTTAKWLVWIGAVLLLLRLFLPIQIEGFEISDASVFGFLKKLRATIMCWIGCGTDWVWENRWLTLTIALGPWLLFRVLNAFYLAVGSLETGLGSVQVFVKKIFQTKKQLPLASKKMA